MALGIHKPGQGYWVRTLTAVFAGVLVFSGAAYAWQQAELIPIPVRDYTVDLGAVRGEVAQGDVLELVGPDAQGQQAVLGTATVAAVNRLGDGDANLTLADPVTQAELEGEAIDLAASVRLPSAQGTQPDFRASITNVLDNPAVPLVYVQAAAASVIILIGAILIYWLVYVKRRTSEFLINTDGEMRKVNWSTYREIRGSTIVVIVAAFLIAAILFVIDLAFKTFFTWIDVLQA